MTIMVYTDASCRARCLRAPVDHLHLVDQEGVLVRMPLPELHVSFMVDTMVDTGRTVPVQYVCRYPEQWLFERLSAPDGPQR